MVDDSALQISALNIINEVNFLNDELEKRNEEIQELKSIIDIQRHEHDLYADIEKIRALLKENNNLKAENEELKKRKTIIDSIVELIKEERNNDKEKLELSNEQIAELYGSGLTAYKIGQLDGTGQQTVINKLKKMEKWQKREAGNQFKKQ